MVTKSVVTAITKSKSASLHMTAGKRLIDITINTKPISWTKSAMTKYKAVLYTGKYTGLPSEVKDKKVEYTKTDIEIWIAAQPFAAGELRFAYAALIDSKKVVIKESKHLDLEYNTEKVLSFELYLCNQFELIFVFI